ncbi:MAG: Rid family hydrolase [Rhizobiaceae bacterium]|jgi:enamine deaminase RidA (YjgF/YER057c/UK114 family)|nr:Rid family hydrolase [Rhizobiaceae bacterium]
MRIHNPATVPQPASAYAQAIEVPAAARRLVIGGQVGVRADGTVCEGYEAQAGQAWSNIEALLTSAGMSLDDLVSVRVYDVAPGDVAAYRAIRDTHLKGRLIACTYVIVAGLASPHLLTEIEAEAVKA